MKGKNGTLVCREGSKSTIRTQNTKSCSLFGGALIFPELDSLGRGALHGHVLSLLHAEIEEGSAHTPKGGSLRGLGGT